MKSYWIVATVVLLTAWPSTSNACTQTSVAAAKEPAAKPSVAAVSQPSSYMLVELKKSLKVKNLKPGDRFRAEVSQDVLSHGKIIIPVETQLVGHVTEVRVRDGENSESRLGIVFDTILLKHSHDIHFQAVVQAVSAPAVKRSLVDEPSQMLPPSMLGGGPRGSSASPVGGATTTGATRGQSSVGSSSNSPVSASSTAYQVPLTVKNSPTTNTATGTSAVQMGTDSSGKPLSVGTPQGVMGLKGLSLSSAPSAATPGPVIVSNTGNIKLESGTQILLYVVSVESPKTQPNKIE